MTETIERKDEGLKDETNRYPLGVCQICGKSLSEKTVALLNTDFKGGIEETLVKRIGQSLVHDHCNKNWHKAQERKEEIAEANDRSQHWTKLCPPEFAKALDWKNPRCKKQNYDKVFPWRGDGKGLLIVGETGLCKTRFVFKMLGRHHVSGKTISMMSHARFRTKITTLSQSDPTGLVRFVGDILKADIWFLDDLGNGRFTPASEEAFEAILNQRTEQNKPCIFTSLYNQEQLLNAMSPERGASIVRRLLDFCEVIQFS